MKNKKQRRLLELANVDVDVDVPVVQGGYINTDSDSETQKEIKNEIKLVKHAVPIFKKKKDIHINANNIRLVL